MHQPLTRNNHFSFETTSALKCENYLNLLGVAFPGQYQDFEIVRPQLEVLAESLDAGREDGVLRVAGVLVAVLFEEAGDLALRPVLAFAAARAAQRRYSADKSFSENTSVTSWTFVTCPKHALPPTLRATASDYPD